MIAGAFLPTAHMPAFSQDFDRLVARACARIPARFRKRLENVAILVAPEPSAEQLARSGVRRGGTLLGLYEGRPLPKRSVFEGFTMPDRITIFQGPHERLAESPEHLARMVEDTVWHEVAHYFGLNEMEVRRAERKRRSEG
jgi:predicted Zn-dependent protease with MMP-like domain